MFSIDIGYMGYIIDPVFAIDPKSDPPRRVNTEADLTTTCCRGADHG
jgi:hypothetical protein